MLRSGALSSLKIRRGREARTPCVGSIAIVYERFIRMKLLQFLTIFRPRIHARGRTARARAARVILGLALACGFRSGAAPVSLSITYDGTNANLSWNSTPGAGY